MNDSSRTQGGLICVAVVVIAAWFLLGARPFWADYRLREGVEEHRAFQAIIDEELQN